MPIVGRAIVVVVIAVLVAASGIGSGAAAPARTVDVGGGRGIYLQCRGRGSPTVVLVSGAGGASDEWTHVADAANPEAAPTPSTSAVFRRVARFTRVCAYDRPGTRRLNDEPGRSDPVPQPTTAQSGATDLRAVLKAAGERGPYVLVGASWGGVIVNLFARENPNRVAGLVFVDGASNFFQDALTPDQWNAWMQLIATTPPGREAPDYESSFAAIRAASPLPDVPAVVLTADKPWNLPLGDLAPTWPAWLAAQDQLTKQLDAKHMSTTNSSHGIAVENPRVVAKAIREVVDEAR